MGKVLIEEQYLHDIADSIRKMTGKKDPITTDSMAREIEQVEIVWDPEEQWQRPIDWPDYSQIDLTNFEGMYFTYDTSNADPSQKREWVAIYCVCTGGFDVQRGQIVNGSFVAENTVYTGSGGVFREWLPQTITGYVVYKLTPHTNGNHITSIGMRDVTNTQTGDGFALTYPHQKCLERYGRLPYLTSFSNWSNYTVKSDTIWDLKNLTSFSSVFGNCFEIENIDLKGYDSRVTTCYYAFRNCWKLKYVNNTDKLVTSACTSMNNIFYNCFLLKYIDSSSWDTSNVTTMVGAFNACYLLYKLDTSNWNTSKVTSLGSCFNSCQKLQKIDVSNFDTSKVTGTGFATMFCNCTSVKELDVSNFNVNEATSFSQMFYGCRALSYLDLSNWKTSKVTNMEQMFRYCSGLEIIDGLDNFDMSIVTTAAYMFQQCYRLQNLDLSSFDMPLCTNLTYFIYSTVACESIALGSTVTSGAISGSNFNYFFGDNYFTKELDLSGLDLSALTEPSYSCAYGYAIEKIVLPDSLHAIGTYFFRNDSNLQTIVLPSTTLVTLTNTNAFSGCSRAKTIYVPDNLVSSYQNASGWSSLSNVTFAPLSTYTG